jgi:hypothetical protein
LRWSLTSTLAASLSAKHDTLPALQCIGVSVVEQLKKAFTPSQPFWVVFNLFEHTQALLWRW